MIATSTLHCDFCGLDFDPACAPASCQGCPLHKACSQINCPRCGYPCLPESRLSGWLKTFFQRKNIED